MSRVRIVGLALVGAALVSCGFVASAHALVFDFSYSGGSGSGAVSGSGTFTTGSTGSPYTVTGVTGVANGFTITGLSSYASADQLLYDPASHYVDFSGISFSTSNKILGINDAWGIGWTGSSYGIAELFKDAIGYCCGTNPISFTVTPEVRGAPGPVAGGGLPGLVLAAGGLLWWRNRRKSPRLI
jgi:hypothetical protein